ncbi:putative glycosyl transferase family 2 [Streptomyces sp. Tu6071]|nr:putative glycosyl transferase family 2 [Streptomyces sp. Tu6071]
MCPGSRAARKGWAWPYGALYWSALPARARRAEVATAGHRGSAEGEHGTHGAPPPRRLHRPRAPYRLRLLRGGEQGEPGQPCAVAAARARVQAGRGAHGRAAGAQDAVAARLQGVDEGAVLARREGREAAHAEVGVRPYAEVGAVDVRVPGAPGRAVQDRLAVEQPGEGGVPAQRPYGADDGVPAARPPAPLPGEPVRGDEAVGVGRGEPHALRRLVEETERGGCPGGARPPRVARVDLYDVRPGRLREGRRRVGAGVGDDHDPHARPDGQGRVAGGAAQGGEGVREQRLLVVGGDDDREGGQLARGTRDVQGGAPVRHGGAVRDGGSVRDGGPVRGGGPERPVLAGRSGPSAVRRPDAHTSPSYAAGDGAGGSPGVRRVNVWSTKSSSRWSSRSASPSSPPSRSASSAPVRRCSGTGWFQWTVTRVPPGARESTVRRRRRSRAGASK